MKLKIISAGAGSGKTYRLTSEMVQLLKDGVRASGIMATTFTRKAAAELQERVRVRLLEEGLTTQADDLANALIGTVHGLGVKLLRRFAFEAGVSPQVDIVAEEDEQVMFNQALATVLTQARVEHIEALSTRLGFKKREDRDWRKEVRDITDVARANNFSAETLRLSRDRSFETFAAFLGQQSEQPPQHFEQRLAHLLDEAITTLPNNGDTTKKTQTALEELRKIRREMLLRGHLHWYQWVQIAKLDVGVKSRDDVAELTAFARAHDTHPAFHDDIRQFIHALFDLAADALHEYDRYKKQRGLIDYTDMEALVLRLLADGHVREVLASELDLLMVDEFQDTSPMQLDIFLKLSHLAQHSIWVGDPKQSIYGFRGAEPRLMQAIVQHVGGVKPEDIQIYSWRSREDIVAATNAIFIKAFPHIPPEQVALRPKRTKQAHPDGAKAEEPPQMGQALVHWHFEYDGEGRPPGKPWLENALAEALKTTLDRGLYVLPKGEKAHRPARPGDVAILCRSNTECLVVAQALHRVGLQAAIACNGLLDTAEARLILACLKYILNHYDSLSVAEILLLATGKPIEDIVADRMAHLAAVQIHTGGPKPRWGQDEPFVRRLYELRSEVVELSSAEILNLLLEDMDLRRIIVRWGNARQRLDNVDALRQLALRYEDACTRLHSAASLGGFLLWLNDLQGKGKDDQGAGESPDAVQVMTYHKSKGLEWPVVVCHSMEQGLRADLWGLALVPEEEGIDLQNVLARRWLRYWPNPYSDQIQQTNLDERIKESDAQAERTAEARQEEARLLYVGLTRARDYLVLPTAHRPTKWLNRVCHEGKEEHFVLEADTDNTPWTWEGRHLDKQTHVFRYGRDFTYAEVPPQEVPFFPERAGKALFPPLQLDANAKDLKGLPNLTSVGHWSYAAPLPLPEGAERYPAAKATKAFLTADYPDYDPADRLGMAQGIADRYGIADLLDAADLTDRAKAWHEWQQRHFAPARTWRKYAVRHLHHGQWFSTVIDLLMETPTGWVIVQNSGFLGDSRQCERQAKHLAPWLALARTAVQQVTGGALPRTYVHFVCAGVVVEMG